MTTGKIEIPDVPDARQHPAVVEVGIRDTELRVRLAAVVAERDTIARELGGDATRSERDLRVEALFSGGVNVEAKLAKIARLGELRETEVVIGQALAMSETAAIAAMERARREMTPDVGAMLDDLKAVVARRWWEFLIANDSLNSFFDRLRSVGLADGYSKLFAERAPAVRNSALPHTVRELIARGHLTDAEVEEAFPVLLSRGW